MNLSKEEKEKEKEEKNNNKNNINIQFSEFWNLYDKKVGDKKRCEKKWDSLTNEERQKIKDTLPMFLGLIKDKQFQPHPETYLNQNRWNDEVVANTKKKYKLYNEIGTTEFELTESELQQKFARGWKL